MELGFGTIQEAKDRLRLLGRSGQMPWAAEHLKPELDYISPTDLIVLPTWHMIPRGVLRQVLVYCLTTPVGEVSRTDPFVFNSAARKRVSVRRHAMQYLLCAACVSPAHIWHTVSIKSSHAKCLVTNDGMLCSMHLHAAA